MKNKIYLIGIFSLVTVTIGGIFKLMHWPGAGILLMIGILSLTLLFFPFALYSSFKNNGKKNKALYIAAFVTLLTDFVGALFKIMHWPGAGWLLLFGITFPVAVFLPVFLYFHFKDKERSLNNFLYIIFFLAYLSVMSALLAVEENKKNQDDKVPAIEYVVPNHISLYRTTD